MSKDEIAAVEGAAFGSDSAFRLLLASVPLNPLLINVEHVIIDDRSFNAFAQQTPTQDVIGIHTGILPTIVETIHKIKDFIPSLRPGSNLRAELWWDELDEDEVIYRLSRFCVDFIVFHELSHIALNHCLATHLNGQSAPLFETSTNSQDGMALAVETRHAFEAFADKVAASLLASSLLRLGTLHRRFVFKHPAAAVSGLAWANQIVWAILAGSSKDYLAEQAAFLTALSEGKPVSKQWFTHPHPSLRRSVATNQLASPRWFVSIAAGVQNADSRYVMDQFLSPDRPREARELSQLANSPKVVRRFRNNCNAAWTRFRDLILPHSRYQSGEFVRGLIAQYGYDRLFRFEYGVGERRRVLEEVTSPTPPTLFARNDGKLPRKHWAHEL